MTLAWRALALQPGPGQLPLSRQKPHPGKEYLLSDLAILSNMREVFEPMGVHVNGFGIVYCIGVAEAFSIGRRSQPCWLTRKSDSVEPIKKTLSRLKRCELQIGVLTHRNPLTASWSSKNKWCAQSTG